MVIVVFISFWEQYIPCSAYKLDILSAQLENLDNAVLHLFVHSSSLLLSILLSILLSDDLRGIYCRFARTACTDTLIIAFY